MQQAKTLIAKTTYPSKIDWWIWAIVAFVITVIIIIGITSPWWLTLLLGLAILIPSLTGLIGIWYAIEGNNLIVYQFFRPKRYPIKKIKDVRYSKGFLAAPALSSTRLAIRFTDRNILRSSLPLEISPSTAPASSTACYPSIPESQSASNNQIHPLHITIKRCAKDFGTTL